jgi:hypothetical protein
MQNIKYKVKHNRFPKELNIRVNNEHIVLSEEFIYMDSHLGVIRIPKGFDCVYTKNLNELAVRIIFEYSYKTQLKSRLEINNMIGRALKDANISFVKRFVINLINHTIKVVDWYGLDDKTLIRYRVMGRR